MKEEKECHQWSQTSEITHGKSGQKHTLNQCFQLLNDKPMNILMSFKKFEYFIFKCNLWPFVKT